MSEMAGNIPWNDMFRANRLARDAHKEMPDLRVSQGMIQADRGFEYAANQVLAKRLEVIDVSIALGQGDPMSGFAGGDFARAVRRIQQGPGASEITILAEDDPEVTRSYEVRKDMAHFAEYEIEMDDTKKIEKLVEKFYKGSLVQRGILAEFSDLMQARRGGDWIVRFGNSRAWNANSFQALERHEWVLDIYIDGYCPLITSVDYGEES